MQQYQPIQQSDQLRLSTPFLHQPFPMQPAITQAEPQLSSLTHLQTPPIQTEPLSLQTPMKQTTQLPNSPPATKQTSQLPNSPPAMKQTSQLPNSPPVMKQISQLTDSPPAIRRSPRKHPATLDHQDVSYLYTVHAVHQLLFVTTLYRNMI